MAERRTWATERERMLMAQAWDDGLDAGRDRWMDSREFGDAPVNPYRSGEGDRPAEDWATETNRRSLESLQRLKADAYAQNAARLPHHFHMSSYSADNGPRCWCGKFGDDPIHGEQP